MRYEWNFAYDAEFTDNYLPPRYDEETTVPFDTSGTFYVRLQVIIRKFCIVCKIPFITHSAEGEWS
jgi:hypothetical protein